jgi:hypothetical protein
MSSEPSPDRLNRLLVTLLALGVIVLASLAILLAWTAPDGTIEQLTDAVTWLDDHNDRDGRFVLTMGAIVVILLALTILVLELSPANTAAMPVRNVASGTANITTAEIAARINAAVEAVAHVAGCEAAVTRRGKKVEIVLDLHVDPGADLAHTADEACRHAHLLVEQELGIELASMPRARLHYRELRLGQQDETPRPPSGWERPPSEEHP